MDFMKVIDQTVREIKRDVILKVIKVPKIEQKAFGQSSLRFQDLGLTMTRILDGIGYGKSGDWQYSFRNKSITGTKVIFFEMEGIEACLFFKDIRGVICHDA